MYLNIYQYICVYCKYMFIVNVYIYTYLYVYIYIYHTAAAIFSRLWQVVPSADTSAVTIEKEVATLQVPVVQCSCNSHQNM